MNRLASATSPYLRQHADNPVDWFPWGEEAFARARELNRPLLVSIGYSSCHWCHVMAHECFEDEAIAAAMNADFVPVKVDREEHPDVDAIYMEALQALTGSGGWPLNIFVTPSGEPFFGGTYFPPKDHAGRPGFPTVLRAIAAAWRERRGEIDEQAAELTRHVAARPDPPRATTALQSAGRLVATATARFSELYDPQWGGIGSAPKFPQAPMLELLLRAHLSGEDSALEMVSTTLLAMASGGIYDQLAGGFARYSVDRYWRVPHFEKMLYDQAVLARCYLHAYQVTGDERLLQVVRETCQFVLRDLAADGGGLCSSFDADSPGGEGAYYTWTPAELDAVLGAELGAAAAAFWGVSERGNFEHGRSVLELAERGALVRPPEIERARALLVRARSTRPGPARDDKILTEWNALMAAALAEIAAATGDSEFEAAAAAVVDFLLEKLRRPDGRLLRSYMDGVAEHLATAADYAALIDACCRVAECTGRARYLEAASGLADDLLARFLADDGGLYLTGSDAPRLVLRPTDRYDGVIPGATSQAAGALWRLGALLGRTDLASAARRLIEHSADALAAGPLALAHLLGVYLTVEEGQLEVVLAGARADLRDAVRRRWRPNVVLAWGEPMATPLWEGRDDDRAYVCRDAYCLAPLDDADELAETLDRLALAER